MYNMEDSENPLVQKGNRKCHLCEVALLLLLTLLLCGLFVLRGSLLAIWIMLCFAGAILFFFLAVRYSKDAFTAYRSVEFRISHRRLKTLEAVGVAGDVLGCLSEIEGRHFKGEKKFFGMLERALGSERTREVRAVLFKYTRL